MTRRELSGWGRTAPTAADVLPAGTERAAMAAAAASGGTRGALARGLGRSYGDAAQNAGGTVLDMTAGVAAVPAPDADGILTAPAGASLELVLRRALAHGWCVPVVPGTRHVTLGGAVAADIHGKNHHAHGSFGGHVRSIRLVTGGDDGARVLGPTVEPEAYWATVGGLGLTGAISEVTLQLRPVETSRMVVDTSRSGDLDATMAALEAADAYRPYSVAWIDLATSGRRLGRGVLTAGDHAPASALGRAGDARAYDPGALITAPPWSPSGLVNRVSTRAFNEVWFRRAPRRRVDELQRIDAFFHPLDAVRHWNRLYGARGFVQHQCVVPFGEETTLRRIVERLATSGTVTFLAVLKRFGAASPAPLSFPLPGWTLALDLPAGQRDLATTLDELDRLVVDAGGRAYLVKDGRVDPGLVRAMYPRLDEWRAARARLDPCGRWQSDLGRRLGLIGGGGAS